ncbi:MAG: hypothetical protein GY832_13175 [Chloroflexi bacterium]|nr:hypothetical protein [Chloroflexota bacterium]
MGKTEHIGLWILVALTSISLIVLSVIVTGELAEINQQLLVLMENDVRSVVDTSVTDEGVGGSAHVEISHVQVLTNSVTMTVTVKAHGAGDLLFEPPELQSTEGTVYPATGESVADARIAFLDLVTRGEAVTRLEFSGRASPTAGLWLIFNPHQETTNSIAPQLRVAVSLRDGE